MQGTAPREEVRRLVAHLWESLLWREQVVLPRVLRAAPTLPSRVTVSAVIARAYGGGHSGKMHTRLVQELLVELGGSLLADAEEVMEEQRGQVRALPWISGLAALLVDRTVGPAVAARIAGALRRNYGISERGTAYFRDLEEHGVTDTAACLELVDAAVVDATSRADVEKSVATALLSPPGTWFACRLGPISTSFSFQTLEP